LETHRCPGSHLKRAPGPFGPLVMNQATRHYTVLDHTADLGIKVWGSGLGDLFKNAGLALMDLIVEGKTDDSGTTKEISVLGHDLSDLMVRWLGEILYLFEGEGLVVTDIHIEDIRPSKLDARVRVTPFDPNSHEILSEIKAVTYHQSYVKDLGGQWETRIIFDL